MSRKNAERHGKSRGNGANAYGMSETLLLYIVLFFAATVILLWCFQSFFLDDFYRAEKKKDAVSACAELLRIGDNTEEEARLIAERYGACVTAYRIGGEGSIETLVDTHVLSHCTVHNTDIRSKNKIYESAKNSGGVFLQYFEYYPERETFESISEDEAALDTEVSLVYGRVFRADGQRDTLIVIDTVITPVNATVRTVRVQLALFTAVFILSAVLFAFLLSRRFTAPIKRLTRAAVGFGASGKRFDADSVGGEYREIRELTDTLSYASTELEKTETLRRELLANVSHDLRTPLTTIIGYAEMMRDLPGESTPENAANIVREAERLNRLVVDMFELSRIQSGARALKKERFSITETLRETVLGYSEMLERDGYRITLEGAENDVFVQSDEVMIGQVVQNFLLNAVRHSGEGREITVKQIALDGWVTVAVCDKGEGIPADKLSGIWERYYKVNSAHARVEGSGLGLSIVKAIMEQAGGHYGVESAVGKGSNFWFALQISE